MPRTDHSHQLLLFVTPLVTGFVRINSLECLSLSVALGNTFESSDSQCVFFTGALPTLCSGESVSMKDKGVALGFP